MRRRPCREHVVLDGDHHADKDVVLGLGLDLHIELLHSQIHRARDFLHERELEVQPRLGNPFEFAKPLDDGRGLLLDHKEERVDGRPNAFGGSG